ncbi:trifunctional dihydropteroate synthetase [Tulasnella sp. JGI-2019a]|nr:trifunctional dihydropteroate synthetase [Tulasnella sp. JGI-2019a]
MDRRPGARHTTSRDSLRSSSFLCLRHCIISGCGITMCSDNLSRGRSRDWIIINSLSLPPIPLGSSLWARPSASTRPQPVTTSVAIPLPLPSIRLASASDHLATSVNYGTLAKTIEHTVSKRNQYGKEERFACMEELAEGIAQAAFGEFDANAIREIQVVVAKPRALLYAKEAAVRITRRRLAGVEMRKEDEDGFDQILIRDLELSTIIGLNPWEREAKQVVRINLEMDVRPFEPARAVGFDYTAVVDHVSKTVLDSSYLTVEALVTEIARAALTTPTPPPASTPQEVESNAEIHRITVRLAKPSALMFAEAPEVQITRTPQDFPLQAPPLPPPESDKVKKSHTAAIAFGSNVGNRFDNVERALQALERKSSTGEETKVVDTSFLYESEAMYVEDQRRFVNGACLIVSSLSPTDLLDHLKNIEVEVGRTPTFRNGPRVVDLDLIFYDDLVYDSRKDGEVGERQRELTIPHVSMQEREFVLKPLNDIIPNFVHPVLHLTISDLYRDFLKQHATATSTLRKVIPFYRQPALTPTGTAVRESPERFWTWGSKTYIMAIINTTPDSFSDGGDYATVDRAIEFINTFPLPPRSTPSPSSSQPSSRVDIIDIGGYSTRPGAAPISPEDEISRTIPLIKAIRGSSSNANSSHHLISIDTFRGSVATAALEAGADVINDVYGLTRDPEILRVVRDARCPVIMMHSRGDAGEDKVYGDDGVMAGARGELGEKVGRALQAGVRRWNVIVDPGLGFSKTVEDNLTMIRRLDEFTATAPLSNVTATRTLDACVMSVHPLAGMPILVGASRKSFLGQLIASGVEGEGSAKGRLAATVAAHVAAIQRGADVIRVHDVMEAWDSVRVADGLSRLT